MELERVACNLCHSNDTEPLFTGHDRLHGLPGSFPVVRCRQCGLVYLNPRPTQEKIGKYYPKSYQPHVFFERIRRSRRARLDYYYGLRKRRRAIERLTSVGKLLDVGCGSGSFLHYMQHHGWEVWGQEISQTATGYARRELGLEVCQDYLEYTSFPADSFDVVTLWNVLEHLHDPATGIVRIRELLKPDGLLVIAVPNAASWDAQLFGPAWVGYDAPRHLYTYDKRTLSALLKKASFRVVESRCLFGSYQAIVDSVRFMLHGQEGDRRTLQYVVDNLASWWPIRLLAAPFLRVMDALEKGSVMTTFCHPDRRARDKGEG